MIARRASPPAQEEPVFMAHADEHTLLTPRHSQPPPSILKMIISRWERGYILHVSAAD